MVEVTTVNAIVADAKPTVLGIRIGELLEEKG
jgi:hypothetical protein